MTFINSPVVVPKKKSSNMDLVNSAINKYGIGVGAKVAQTSNEALWSEAMTAANPQARQPELGNVIASNIVQNRPTAIGQLGKAIAGGVSNVAQTALDTVGTGMRKGQIISNAQQQVAGKNQPTVAQQPMTQQSNKAVETALFNMLKTNQIDTSSANWTNRYVQGAPSIDQKMAMARYGVWQKYGNLNGDQLADKLSSGELVVGSPYWNDLMTLDGQETPAMQYAQQKYDSDMQIQGVNDMIDFASLVYQNGYQKADITLKPSVKTDQLTQQINDLLSRPMTSMAERYQELVVNNPELKELTEQAAGLQSEIDKVDVETLYLEDEIRDLVEGEAHEGYVQALASEKAKPLYKKKMMLIADFNRVNSMLQYEQETRSKMFEYEMQDEQNMFNRTMQTLNFGLDMAQWEDAMRRADLQDQLAIANYNINVENMNRDQYNDFIDNQIKVMNFKQSQIDSKNAQSQQMLDNEMKLQEFLYQIPQGQVVTLSSGIYQGLGNNGEVTAYKRIEPNGDTYVTGLDQNGTVQWDTFIGKTETEESSLTNLKNQWDLGLAQGVAEGNMVKVGSEYYNKNEWEQYKQADNALTVFQEAVDKYENELANTKKNNTANTKKYPETGGGWANIFYYELDPSKLPTPPEIPDILKPYVEAYQDESDFGVTRFRTKSVLNEPASQSKF